MVKIILRNHQFLENLFRVSQIQIQGKSMKEKTYHSIKTETKITKVQRRSNKLQET